jgi:hypothetical protein
MRHTFSICAAILAALVACAQPLNAESLSNGQLYLAATAGQYSDMRGVELGSGPGNENVGLCVSPPSYSPACLVAVSNDPAAPLSTPRGRNAAAPDSMQIAQMSCCYRCCEQRGGVTELCYARCRSTGGARCCRDGAVRCRRPAPC